jgi:hypothetical protein
MKFNSEKKIVTRLNPHREFYRPVIVLIVLANKVRRTVYLVGYHVANEFGRNKKEKAN